MSNEMQKITEAVEKINEKLDSENKRIRLQALIPTKTDKYLYIETIFDNYFIYSLKNSFFKQEYLSIDEQNFELKGSPIEVIKHITWREKE